MNNIIMKKLQSYGNQEIANGALNNETNANTSMNNSPMNTTPMSNTKMSNSSMATIPTSNSPMATTPTSNSKMSNSPTSNSPMSNSPMSNSPMSNSPMSNSPMSNSPMSNSPMSNSPMSNSPTETPPTDTPQTNSNKPTLESPHTNVQIILEKIQKLPISNDDKAILMNQFKENIMNPSRHEDKNLEDIQNKYLKNIIPQSQMNLSEPNIYTHIPQYNMIPQEYNPYQPKPTIQSDVMTTAHFEILKNKIDSLQYELIDLLRHVKDYTQRYMNSVRQQDLDKINEYINGLFEIDKALKETKEKAAEALVEPVPVEEQPETQESVIAKTTNGIKNALGSFGDSVSGLTSLVSSTADIANSYLSKPIIKKKEDNTNPSINTSSKPSTSADTTNSTKKNKCCIYRRLYK